MEIYDLMESHERKKRQEARQQIARDFTLAEAIAQDVGAIFSKDIKAARPWDYYPGLFKEDRAAYELAQEKEELEAYKERKRAYAIEHNKMRERGL